MIWLVRNSSRREKEKLDALNRSLALIEFTPEGVVLSANENFCRLMGYTADEIVGQPHRLFVEPAYAQSEEYRAFWGKLGSGIFDSDVYKRLRKDGAPLYIRATYNPIVGPGGRVSSVLKVAADVTETRLQALENAAKMSALSRVQGVIEFKPSGEILDANDNFFVTMGYARHEVIGHHHRMFVDPAFAASADYAAFWRKLNAGEPVVDSFHRLGKGGKPVWLQASYSPVLDIDGRAVKVIKFAYDITDLLMLGGALARLSHNDLSRRLDRPFASTFDRLRRDFNVAADNLHAMLSGIVKTISLVSAGATSIATASQDLSHRTESQAASLEQTAAALSEVTGAVQKATQNARLANAVAGEAKRAAEQSGEIVSRAVEAMGRIEHSSAEIGAIIGVIDEIAFQTNLLALNAGVEAARAGEAGRGFAVVAAEVRALAQRSAEAARRIKALIAASEADVGAGVDLVRRTGEALGAIVAKVVEIDSRVAEIASAAETQDASLGEVNESVRQMDQATQRNAAMAEEAHAAVGSMTQQLDALSDVVGQFELAERSSGGVARAA